MSLPRFSFERFLFVVGLGVMLMGCATEFVMPTPSGIACCTANSVVLATQPAMPTEQATAPATESATAQVETAAPSPEDTGGEAAFELLNQDLFLPTGWLSDPEVNVAMRVLPQMSAISLSHDGVEWGDWVPVTGGMTVTTRWDFGEDGINKPVYARAQDSNGRVTNVISGTVNLDTVPPVSHMKELTPHSTRTFDIEWGGEDATSGIESYDVQIKVEAITDWSDWLMRTTRTTATYDGEPNETYFFRVRARDAAGNVEEWREFDITTHIPQTD